MNKRITNYILALLVSVLVWAQVPAPAGQQESPIAIVNGTAHLGNGKVINNAIITFKAGKIEQVSATKIDLAGYKIVDAVGQHIYPGLILPVTRLGLEEVSSVRASRDYQETGDMNPNIRSLVAYNTDSEIIPTMKFNGIQLAQITPQGGRISGTSSVVQLDAWNWEDAAYKADIAVHMSWPSPTYGARWWMGETERRENKNYDQEIADIKDLFEQVMSYSVVKPATKNLKLDAMLGLLDGSKTLFVEAERAEQIISAITTIKELGVEKMVLVTSTDVWYAKDLLKQYNIPVLLENVHSNPGRDEEGVDLTYKLPGMLDEAGILVGLTHNSGMLANSRNLPFYAGTVAAYSGDKEKALAMVTSNTAKILGIEDRTGTLEAGKDANIVICQGDLLDMRTSVVNYSFIQGREVQLEALQQRLYEKFRKKYAEE